jgi:hypothetical protein
VASGDLVEEVLRLKQQPGNFILRTAAPPRRACSRRSRRRIPAGIHPVVLGRGQPLFCELPRPLDLRLVSMTPFARVRLRRSSAG